MILIKLAVMALCAFLFWYGGYKWLPARRFIMPVCLCGMALWITYQPWVLWMLSCSGTFCLGYGEKSPLRHIFGDGWGRSIWGLLSSVCLSLPLFLTLHIGVSIGNLSLIYGYWPLVFLIVYNALNFTLENALKNVNQKIGDPIIGAAFASIILLIH